MPLDHSAGQALCDAAMPAMRQALCLDDTRVRLFYQREENPDVLGRAQLDTPYRRLDVYVDLSQHETEGEALNTLRHEMLHGVLGEYDAYLDVVKPALPFEVQDVERRMAVLVTERTVERLERMLDWLGWTPEALAGRLTTCSACGKTWRAVAPEGTASVECPKCGENVTHGRQPSRDDPPAFRLLQFEKGDGAGGDPLWVLFDCASARVLGTSPRAFSDVPKRIEDPEAEQPEPLGCGLTQLKHPAGTWTLLNTTLGHVVGSSEHRFAGVPVRAA